MILRLNLAPITGRRDAVYDAVAAFASGPCVFHQVPELLDMLNSAEKDSLELLSLLTSPDTIERERNMLEHIRKVIRLLQVIEAWMGSRSSMFIPAAAQEDDEADPVLVAAVSRLSSLIRNATPHLTRYRAYAEKSASPSHADRYSKSYSFYQGLYQRRLPALPKTVEI